MKPRITISLSEQGTIELSLNEAGRDEFVRYLQSLDRENEHFHLTPEGYGWACELSDKPYRSSDQIFTWGKVLFRPDDWDQQYFPHVMSDAEE